MIMERRYAEKMVPVEDAPPRALHQEKHPRPSEDVAEVAKKATHLQHFKKDATTALLQFQ